MYDPLTPEQLQEIDELIPHVTGTIGVQLRRLLDSLALANARADNFQKVLQDKLEEEGPAKYVNSPRVTPIDEHYIMSVTVRHTDNARRLQRQLSGYNHLDNFPVDLESVRRHEKAEASRKLVMECRGCFYLNSGRLAGQAFSKYRCGICAEEREWPNTAVPMICETCADGVDLCQRCAGVRNGINTQFSRDAFLILRARYLEKWKKIHNE